MKRRNQFLKNAAILTATSLLLRAVGMYFRIYISSVIGAEGVGLYQMILSIYVLVSGFASSGIVVAVTRMTADELACGSRRSVRGVLRKCITVSAAMGITSAVLVAATAGLIGGEWISDPRSISSVRVMAAALPFMSISCCLRGYFTARRRVGVSSVSQITEQCVRIALSFVLIARMAPFGVEYSCLAIMIADVISEAAGCLHVSIGYLLDRRRQEDVRPTRVFPPYSEYRRIWEITAPITASHYLTSLLRTIESILVPDCLTQALFSRARALELFGMLRGMTLPLIFFPSTLLTAFTSLLIPELSEAQALGQTDRVRLAVSRSMRITFLLAIPAAGMFLMFSHELGMLVYNESDVGWMLRILAPLTPLMYVESMVVGILKGIGQQNSSLRYNLIDSVVRIGLIIAVIPHFGMTGFMLVMVVSNLLTPLLHVRRLLKVTDMRFEWRLWLARPISAVSIACCGTMLAMRIDMLAAMPMLLRVCAGAAVMLILYSTSLWLTESGGDGLSGLKRMVSVGR